MLDFKNQTPKLSDYEDDFVQWLDTQTELLRNGRLEQLDREHLIEELNGMSANHRLALASRLEILIQHLLKCQFQPHRKCSSWEATIRIQRKHIRLLLDQSPSLHQLVAPYSEKSYPHALNDAMRETSLPAKNFPPALPYSAEQLLDADFLP
ncbi:DUF29 domain-containing protein [Massilia sp. NR 4-1]|uniref:DUF29 domain-containing protein n=1 Tax=Massilia sp. NR 4-1 TaxID=1678028 RepID=UPI0006A26B1F|nr:DUF29 domain-containing protein [Massilia sp. NR 4-1]AKU25160.1 hypothetical protein ACZ75_25850 [Massilia sp. NR 4-1]